jgi:hypothetical protein
MTSPDELRGLLATLSALIDAKSMAANDAAHTVCNDAIWRLAPTLLDRLTLLEAERERLRESLEAIRDLEISEEVAQPVALTMRYSSAVGKMRSLARSALYVLPQGEG